MLIKQVMHLKYNSVNLLQLLLLFDSHIQTHYNEVQESFFD